MGLRFGAGGPFSGGPFLGLHFGGGGPFWGSILVPVQLMLIYFSRSLFCFTFPLLIQLAHPGRSDLPILQDAIRVTFSFPVKAGRAFS